MNQMIPSEIVAEMPLHFALLSCGALGYMATKWADQNLVRPRVGSMKPKSVSCDDEVQKVEVGEASPTSVNQRRNAKKQSRTCSVSVSCEIQAPAADEIVSSTPAEADSAPAVPPSERFARVLAKKAERKARKAQERLQCQVPPTCQDESSEVTETPQVPEPITTDAMTVDAGGSVVIEATEKEAPLEQNESLEEASSPTKTEGDAALAELSTADEEYPVAWADQEPTSDEEMMIMDLVQSEQECLEFERAAPEYEEHQWKAWSHAPAWEYENDCHINNECDEWMTPFEELVRSPEVAAQWYGVGLAPMPGLDVEPVLAADGRQLYTDGQQFFVLACVDTADGHNPTALQLVSPIVDPCDSKHQEFSEAMYASQEARNPQGYSIPAADDCDWDCAWNLGQA